MPRACVPHPMTLVDDLKYWEVTHDLEKLALHQTHQEN